MRSPLEGVFVRDQALAVARHSDVVVLADGGVQRDLAGGFAIHDEPSDGLRVMRIHYRESRWPQVVAARHLRGLLAAMDRRAAEGRPFDLLHAHVHRAGWSAVLAGRITGTPVVITEHSTEWTTGTMTRGGLVRARLAFAAADLVCPVSEDLRDRIADHRVQARFAVVPNSVDVDRFRPSRRGPRAPDAPVRWLTVCHVHHRKGIDVLLRAMASLGEGLDAELEIVGDGPQRQDCERLATELGIADRVRFAGARDADEVAARLREADAFVLPSRSENLPVSIIEALASGVPVVATRVGGVPEMVLAEDGEVVPPEDAAALARAMAGVSRRLGTIDREAIAARARSRWSGDAVAGQWLDVYREVLTRRRG